MTDELETLKVYYDYKSPYAYLAFEPALELPSRYAVALRFRPFTLRIKGKGQRSIYSEWKARYSYMDARRWANRRGGFRIMGPKKVYDTTAALIGGLFAEREGFFQEYSKEAFTRFFERRLELDVAEEIADLVAECGGDRDGFLAYLAGDGPGELDASVEEAHADEIFGVPIFVLRGEKFWGHDRIPLLEERLGEFGLRR